MTTRAAAAASSTTIWAPAPASGALVASIIAIAWVCGAPLPMVSGWLPALAVALLAAIITRGRIAAAPLGGWALALRARGPVLRVSIVYATGFVAVVLAAVLAGAVGQLLIAFPGATFATLLVLVAALMLDRVHRAAAWMLPLVIVGLALLGARCEAEGPQARGAAYSGPILGIHPFQSTAIVIDGLGPFDLPINDFVEPAGGRGYDPPALAVALEQALHRIAEVHFADGPARARAAFAGAKVDHQLTPQVRERLDAPTSPDLSPRFVVYSGTTGQRSRVELVCPGRRDDPRGPRPETVMSRTCPTKYASEASAGLGVTGRWPGYSELRGNERIGLSQLLGVTRTDDSAGAAWLARERWLYAMIVLAFVLALVVVRRGLPANATITSALPIAVPLVVLLVVAAFARSDFAAIAARATAPPWLDSWHAWRGALVWPAAAAMLAWSEPDLARRRAGLGRVVLAALLVTWIAATDLDAARWLGPLAGGGEGALESAVLGLADAAAPVLGVPIEELEAITAAALAGPMIVGCVVLVRAVRVAAAAASPPEHADRRSLLAVLAVIALAVALGVSRKTGGGIALIPAATGVALVLGSALRRVAARGIWPRSHVSAPAIAIHVAWVAAGLAIATGSLPTEGGDPVRWAYFMLAVGAALLPIAAVFPDPD